MGGRPGWDSNPLIIIVSAWKANQAQKKRGVSPTMTPDRLFEEYLRPVIVAAMEQGVKMADERER